MASAARICSEPGCGRLIGERGAQALTCSDACRSARSRRLRAENAARGEAPPPAEDPVARMQDVVREHATDVARRQITAEVGPVVRAALTDDTLAAIRDLVALTPAAVAAIAEDLASEDAGIRQRAYTLLVKYTIGHPAVVQPEDAGGTAPIQIVIPTPRPEAPPVTVTPEAIVVGGEELRPCDMCHTPKPEADFVDGSDRCRECWEDQQRRVREQFAQDA